MQVSRGTRMGIFLCAIAIGMGAALFLFWFVMVKPKGQRQPAAVMEAEPAVRRTAAEIQGGPLNAERLRGFATVACGQAVATEADLGLTCPVCPQGSDDGGDGSAQPGGPHGGWRFGSLIFGQFTAAGQQEALMRVDGCESHASGFGGDFLLRKKGGQWERMRYIQGGPAGKDCQTLAWSGGQAEGQSGGQPGARDALVCSLGDMHQGVLGYYVLLMTVEPNVPEPSDGMGTSFLSLSDDEAICDESSDGSQQAQVGNINEVHLLSADASGRQDVEILATLGRGHQRWNRKEGSCTDVPTKPYRLLFQNQGDRFEAARGSAELKAFRKEDCCELEISDVVKPEAF